MRWEGEYGNGEKWVITTISVYTHMHDTLIQNQLNE